MAGEHARLSCSGAVRWAPCPGSLTLEEKFPETGPTEESLEGDAAHWVFSSQAIFGEGFVAVNDFAPNGVAVTQDMIYGTEILLNDIDEACRGDPNASVGLAIESRVVSDVIHPENWGTPDAWVFIARIMTLYLWDYKYGHEFVDVFKNWQFLNYVALILDTLKVNGSTDQDITVIMRVVQPRYYHGEGPVREWKVKASDLRGYFNQLRAAAYEALEPNPRTISGSWCTHCRGRHACKALKNSSMAAIDYIDNAVPELLNDGSIGIEYKMLKEAQDRIKSRLSGVAADMEARIRAKHNVVGFTIEHTYGHKKWVGDLEEIAIMGDMNGFDLRKPLDLITPTQALAKRGIDADLLAGFYETPKNGSKMVEQSEAHIAAVFKKVD